MRIVFMGTPDFAAAHLKTLINKGYDVAAVYTKPDTPKGRGMKLSFSPVKEVAVEAGIPVCQPESLRTQEALEEFTKLGAELLIVVAYGKLLPESFLNTPKYGAVNVHASLLPKYRGSAPIQWAVLNGDRVTGITMMYMAAELDAGDIIYQEETEIGEFETSGGLFDRLCDIGCRLIVKTIDDIEAGTAPRTPQDASQATFTKQLSREFSPIDWNKSPREIVKHIYGLQPWPVASTSVGGKDFKIYAAEYTDTQTEKSPGKIVSAGKAGLEIACAGGKTVLITELQQAGKKRMSASAYLLGHSLNDEES